MTWLKERRLTTTQIIAFGFLTAIAIGTILLSLPIAAKDGQATNLLDALFTATTSICVTGLTTVSTANHWSLFGQIVILFLIQFGGLGVITFTTTILLLLGRRITLKERLLIQDSYNLDTLQGLVRLTIKIIKGTLLVEGIAAILYMFQFIPEFGLLQGIWISIFNAVSAFCNAGMDVIGDSSLMPYKSNLLVNGVTMTLIVLGGLGFPVWWDLIHMAKTKQKKKLGIRKLFQKCQLHTKLVLTVTAVLLFGGMFMILILEWDNPDTLGSLAWWKKIVAAMFQSVTLRTAGFLTIPQENFTNATAFLCIIFMFIGGSPSGTAGGVKTVTVAMMILAVISVVKGKEDTEVFHRKIVFTNVRKGMAVVMISLAVLITNTMILSIIEDISFLDVFYEVTSAIGTVGLSRGVTPDLTDAGKIVIAITMYLGRIGPITMALFFNSRKTKANARSLPGERIIVG